MVARPEDVKLGYLFISSPQPNIYVGGVMITDVRGLPIEFRYTEPIQPTKIQQILYGQVLNQYIKQEVILETLTKSLEARFKCLLVADDGLLSYPAKTYSLVRISTTKSSPLGEVGKKQDVSPTEKLLQTSKDTSPVRLQFNSKDKNLYPGEELAGMDDAKFSAIYDMLTAAGQYMDIHEPLHRIEKALEIICQEEGILSPIRS